MGPILLGEILKKLDQLNVGGAIKEVSSSLSKDCTGQELSEVQRHPPRTVHMALPDLAMAPPSSQCLSLYL